MYNIITKLQTKFNQKPKFYLTIFSVFLFLITTLIITIAIYSNLHDERITITNLDSLAKNLSSDKKAELEKLLYFTTKANSDYDVMKLSTTTATIRDHSFKEVYDKYTKIYSGDFLVDIESIQQSYHIYYRWSKDKQITKEEITPYSSYANCVTKAEAIYGYFKCTNPYMDIDDINTKYSQLSMLLPYDTIENNIKIHFSEPEQYYDNGGSFIRITVDACNNNSLLKYGTLAFEKYLKQYNLKASDYKTILNTTCSSVYRDGEGHGDHDDHDH